MQQLQCHNYMDVWLFQLSWDISSAKDVMFYLNFCPIVHSDLVSLCHLRWPWHPSGEVIWVIPITHIAHTLMSDEPFQSYNTFSTYQPFLLFSTLLAKPHIIPKQKVYYFLSFNTIHFKMMLSLSCNSIEYCVLAKNTPLDPEFLSQRVLHHLESSSLWLWLTGSIKLISDDTFGKMLNEWKLWIGTNDTVFTVDTF